MKSVLRTLCRWVITTRNIIRIRNTINTMVITTTNPGTIKAAGIIMAADIGVTVIMPVPPAGKP